MKAQTQVELGDIAQASWMKIAAEMIARLSMCQKNFLSQNVVMPIDDQGQKSPVRYRSVSKHN